MTDKKADILKEEERIKPEARPDESKVQKTDDRPAPHWQQPDPAVEAEEEDELYNDMPV